ncbi:MAG: ribbon-helix-helix protein, CopG family [Chloroflexia bacterium]
MMAQVTSIQLDNAIVARLDTLAAAIGRPRTWVIEQAITRYLDAELGFLEAVEEGIRAAEAGDVVEHQVVIRDVEDFRQRKSTRDQ